MVIEGEMPGSAPPMMPQTTPAMAANAAGVVVSAVQAWANMSIAVLSIAPAGGQTGERAPNAGPDPRRQRNAEQPDEDQVVENGEADRQEHEPGRQALPEIERGGQHQQGDRRQIADRADHGEIADADQQHAGGAQVSVRAAHLAFLTRGRGRQPGAVRSRSCAIRSTDRMARLTASPFGTAWAPTMPSSRLTRI